MHLNILDCVFLLIILAFAVTACMHGFLQELFGKIAVIAGTVVSFLFCGKLAPSIEKIVVNPAASIVLAFLILFIAVFLFVKIIQKLTESFMEGEILGSLDRVLGFLFGALEGLAIVCAILILVKAQPWFNPDKLTEDSFFWGFLENYLNSSIESVRGRFV